MEFQPLGIVNGINFSEYVPCERGFNSIVYVHKSVLEKQNKKDQFAKEKKEHKSKTKLIDKLRKLKKKKEKKNKKTIVIETADKGVQFDDDVVRNDVYSTAIHNDPVLEHTIQLAKNIVPLVIAANKNDEEPTVCFTIKSKKSKKKAVQETCEARQDITYKKERSKKVIETYKNDKILNQRESLSVKETVSFSSSTLDEIHYPPSCCSFSEISDRKQRKKEKSEVKPKHNAKVIASESFEALANEVINNTGDAKLKIQLMNETEKNLLADNIRIPVLNAIRDCISEMIERHDYSNKGMDTVQRFVQCNTEKLDGVMYRLANIEQKLDYIAKEVTKPAQPPRPANPKPKSTLEHLGEDIPQNATDDEDYYMEREKEERRHYDYERRKPKPPLNVLKPRIEIETLDKGHETGGCGEDQPGAMSVPAGMSHQDKQNRVPARFCWTDSARQS